jgi:hypothetical protein
VGRRFAYGQCRERVSEGADKQKGGAAGVEKETNCAPCPRERGSKNGLKDWFVPSISSPKSLGRS